MRTKKKWRRVCPTLTPEDKQDVRIRKLLKKVDCLLPTNDPVLEKLREMLRDLKERRRRPRRVIVSLECVHPYEMPLLTDPSLDHATSDAPIARSVLRSIA